MELRARSVGAGFRHKGQCALCHGVESGNPRQGFPVGKGVRMIGGYRICQVHLDRLEAIAADAGVTWGF